MDPRDNLDSSITLTSTNPFSTLCKYNKGQRLTAAINEYNDCEGQCGKQYHKKKLEEQSYSPVLFLDSNVTET